MLQVLIPSSSNHQNKSEKDNLTRATKDLARTQYQLSTVRGQVGKTCYIFTSKTRPGLCGKLRVSPGSNSYRPELSLRRRKTRLNN